MRRTSSNSIGGRQSIGGVSSRSSRSSIESANVRDIRPVAALELAERPRISAGLPPFDDDAADDHVELSWMKPPPRTNWSVPDNNLKPVPALYPPLNPQCCAYVGDASPSIVAARISECLKKRSVLTEYDDEASTATTLTADRVRFVVYLYRGGRGLPISISSTAAAEPIVARPDFSHGVIVECQRLHGDTISFHRVCRAVLASAKAESDGCDDHRGMLASMKQSPYTYGSGYGHMATTKEGRSGIPNLLPPPPPLINADKKSRIAAVWTLEKALALLHKDRIDAQLLGMESIVCLTDGCSSNIETTRIAGLCVLGALTNHEFNCDHLSKVHDWIYSLLLHRSVLGGQRDASVLAGNITPTSIPDSNTSGLESGVKGTPTIEAQRGYGGCSSGNDAEHVISLRRLALRAFTNSLVATCKNRHFQLRSLLLKSEQWISMEFLTALATDLEGASRPISSAHFGSAHDAALSAKCLRLLTENSFKANNLLRNQVGPPPVVEALERAKMAGLSTHAVLGLEAEHTYYSLVGQI